MSQLVAQDSGQSFAEVLRQFRKSRKLTQQQLAAKLGSSVTAIANWERGLYVPRSFTMLSSISTALDLTPQEEDRLKAAWDQPRYLIDDPLYWNNQYQMRFRIQEEPLRANTLATIFSAFTELNVKCWLIEQSRFADLMDYTQTHQPRFAQEANLRVTRLSYNSPALIFFAGVGQAIGDAMKKALEAVLQAPKETIDAVAQAPERKAAARLENEAAAQALEQQDREARLQEREREIELRERQAEAQLRIAEARLKTVDLTVEHARHLVELLNPEADPQTKAMAARTLVPQLLAFGQVTGLEITLLDEPEAAEPAPKPQG